MHKTLRYIALIPAAGTGSRLGHDVPKQYLRLGERTMLEHSIASMLFDARIERVFVVVAPEDEKWHSICVGERRVEFLPVGGASRAQSVFNGLVALSSRTNDDDRVLVHDAARPCLDKAELARLIDEVGSDDGGGLLAVPLTDTLKRADDGMLLDSAARWVMVHDAHMFRFASLAPHSARFNRCHHRGIGAIGAMEVSSTRAGSEPTSGDTSRTMRPGILDLRSAA